MSENMYTSDRLCKVITQNFREDTGLAIRLKDIEVKRRQAMVRLIIKSLEIERDIGGLVLPRINKEHIKSNYQKKREICANSVRGKSKEVNRKLQNEESYLKLIESPPQPKLSIEQSVDLRQRWNIKRDPPILDCYPPGRAKPLLTNHNDQRRLNYRKSLFKTKLNACKSSSF